MSKRSVEKRPLELVFIRHGESEGNAAGEAAKHGDTSHFTEEFKNRHSSTWDLTLLGEKQAKVTGEWVRENIHEGKFDGYYCSTYKRAKRTAGLLGLPGAKWNVRDYLREHDWGILDAMTNEERRERYPDVMKKRDINKFYFSGPGGESLANVLIRVRLGILETSYRSYADKTVVVVCHGNIMWPVRIIMEGMLPEDFQALRDKDNPMDEINNCQVIQYSRINPHTGKVEEKLNWMRSVCPWDMTRSRNDWQRIERRKYSNEELVAS